MRYTMVTAKSQKLLRQKVGLHLQNGWKLQGGSFYHNYEYVQVMIKEG